MALQEFIYLAWFAKNRGRGRSQLRTTKGLCKWILLFGAPSRDYADCKWMLILLRSSMRIIRAYRDWIWQSGNIYRIHKIWTLFSNLQWALTLFKSLQWFLKRVLLLKTWKRIWVREREEFNNHSIWQVRRYARRKSCFTKMSWKHQQATTLDNTLHQQVTWI